MQRINPYTLLKGRFSAWVTAALCRKRTLMWRYGKDDLDAR